MSSEPVAVVGAGWAGLAAAVALTERGRAVVVFDAAPQPGGRARTAPALGLEVDNGQHIAIGAYSAVLGLAATLGIPADRVFKRLPLAFEQRDARGVRLSLRAPAGSGRFGMAHAFVGAQGLTAGDKFSILRGWQRLVRPPATDVSVRDHLLAAGQPQRAIDLLWVPLCLATLNTPPDIASAQLFVRVLRESLASSAPGASDLLLPACDLGRALPRPAVEWLESRGVEVRLGERVAALVADDRVHAVTTAQGELAVSAVVSAVPPDACLRLVEPLSKLAALAEDLRAFDTQPICTVYLRYPEDTELDRPLLGLAGTTTQWLVDRRTCDQAGIIAAVISADGPHMALDNDALIETVMDEIGRCVPTLPAPSEARVIREKRATFAATVGIEQRRPSARTALPGLVLAGDWTATGLPATLEGAVRSGNAAAREL
ncbi:MAG: hydroxysqualene dehydroxylase HpnE [Gammaproteobacteria bacterium]